MNKLKKVPVIIGPTAIGKTAYALKHAAQIEAEIISADSMQVYRGMNIGTAKPGPEELALIPHHLIDCRDPSEPWTLFSFLENARALLSQKDRRWIVCGGTGLYIQALIYDYRTPDLPPQPEIRKRLQNDSKNKGLDYLYQKLMISDPVAAEQIAAHDEYRIIRALEVIDFTGEPFSKQQIRNLDHAENFELICLTARRETIYDRINARVDQMVEAGLFAEVKALMENGDPSWTSFQALGYKEIIQHFQGLADRATTVELIKKRTRNFAKRQLTWYRRFKNVQWIDIESQ